MKTRKRYSQEVRERAVRMVFEHSGDHGSQWETISSIASKIGCSAETLRNWVRQAERGQGLRAGLTSDERSRLKELERGIGSLGGLTRSSVRRRFFSHRRSSTAKRGDGVIH